MSLRNPSLAFHIDLLLEIMAKVLAAIENITYHVLSKMLYVSQSVPPASVVSYAS